MAFFGSKPLSFVQMGQAPQSLEEAILRMAQNAGGPLQVTGRVSPELEATIPDPTTPKKGGFFKKGGLGRDIFGSVLGSIGDNMAGNDSFAQQAAAYRKAKAEEQAYQRRRADERDDYLWKQQNTPRTPHRWEANDGSLMEIGPDGQARKVYQDPTPKTNWIQVQTPEGLKIIPVGPNGPMMGGQPPVLSDEDILKLDQNGGPRPPASGFFR